MQDHPRSERDHGFLEEVAHVDDVEAELPWREGEALGPKDEDIPGEKKDKRVEEGDKGEEEGVDKIPRHPPSSPTLSTPLNPKGAPLPLKISTTPSSASSSSSSSSISGASNPTEGNVAPIGPTGAMPVVNVLGGGGSGILKDYRGPVKDVMEERGGSTEERKKLGKRRKEPEEERKGKGRSGPSGSFKDLGKKFSRSSLPTLNPNITSSACPSPNLNPRTTSASRAPSPLGSPQSEDGPLGSGRRRVAGGGGGGGDGIEDEERDYFSGPSSNPSTTSTGTGERVRRTGPGIKEALLNPSENHIKYQFDAESSIKLYCKVFFAGQFEALRRNCGYDGMTYIESLSRCVRWSASGGKSGSAFLKTRDDRLLIKQMSRAELDAFLTFAPAYFAYMSRSFFHELPTMLAKVFGFYRIGFKNPVTGKSIRLDVLIMENLFYNRKFTKIFDLKGSMRNRHVSTEEKHAVLLDENLVECEY